MVNRPNRPKREPSAEIRQAATTMHELFTALIDEGFTETQALTILGSMLPHTQQQNPGGEGQ